MTSKVALQVDRLASLVDDSVVSVSTVAATVTSDNNSASSPSVSSLKNSSSSSTPSPPDPTASSSSSSLSSVSQEPENSVNNNETADNSSPISEQPSRSNNQSTLAKAKKRKMDFDDSGIPMDGIETELDSSTTPTQISPILPVSTSMSSQPINNSPTSAAGNLASSIRAAAGNKTLIGLNATIAYEDELKYNATAGGGCSPDHGINPNDNSEDNSASQAQQQQQEHGRAQSSGYPNCVRGFGDLFDDDDLD